MGFSYNVNVLNQKGSPALYTDTFANRPAFGYAGRLFIANDTSAIYEDTGTAWVLIANVSSGAGTLEQVTTNGNTTTKGISISAGGLSTNSLTDTALTLGSVLFAGAAGLITQDNAAFFWDDTNNRLGINTVTPTNTLDLHYGGTGSTIGINNTAGNQSAILFVNTGVNKWRIGNSSTNTFDIYNSVSASNAISITNSNNRIDVDGNTFFKQSIALKMGSGSVSASGYTTIHSVSGTGLEGIGLDFTTGSASLSFNSTNARTYIFPNADGTIALTSNLASYLPLAGGTLSGNLGVLTTVSPVYPIDVNGAARASDVICGGSTYSADGTMRTRTAANTTTALINSNGFSYITGGKFGIGSSTDDTINALQVSGSATFTGNVTSSNGKFFVVNTYGYFFGDNSNLTGWQGSNGTQIIQGFTGGTERFSISSSGVTKIVNLAGTGSRAVLADASGNLSAPVSDISVKENIEPLKYGLDTIMKLNAVQFEFIEGYKNYGEGLQIGAIAQEVEQIIPEAVFKTPLTELKGIDYTQFHGIYIKAIQDQQKIIESLIQRIELLENK